MKTSKNILERAKKQKKEKAKVSFTLDSNSYEAFKEKCEKNKVPMSRVLDELMKDFVNGV